MNTTQADALYELIATGFAELGVSDPRCLSRTFLLRNMQYAGQRYRCGDWQAVWLIDSNTADFYDAAGNHVNTLGQTPEILKKAG